MKYKQTLFTSNKSKGVNTCEYIILHHTATQEGSIKGVLNTLTVGPVSVHYVVDTNGDTYKIGEDTDILWHAGVSSWKGKKNLNAYSIGIEVIGPLSNGGFTAAQKIAVSLLLKELCKIHDLDATKILRHKDISPGRKIDILDTFWSGEFVTWDDYKKSIFTVVETDAEKMVREFADKYNIRKRGNNESFSCFEVLSILARMDK